MNYQGEAERVIQFIETYCRVPSGKDVGKSLRLRGFQKRAIREIYDTPTRSAILTFGRKNAKTTLAGCLLLAHLVGPVAERNSQINSSAQSRDQAALVFDQASKMVLMNPDLREIVQIRETAKELIGLNTGVHYKALSADATNAMGRSPVMVIHDELGEVRGPTGRMYDALETAMGAYERPLSIIISTQAATDADLLSILIDDAKAGHDPLTKLLMYAAEEDDDPWAEETWRKANPALGDFLNIEEIRRQAEKAKRLPSQESTFRNRILNQRVASSEHFLSPAVWKLNAGPIDDSLFHSEAPKIFAGLDLSMKNDLTALVCVAISPDGTWHIKPYFFAPEVGVRERAERDKAPYDLWAQQGLLTLTPGPVVDYAWVVERMIRLHLMKPIERIAYDEWNINVLKREIERQGIELPLLAFRQGYKSMSPAIQKLEDLALQGRLRTADNPLLLWCIRNAAVESDPAGNRKFNKARSTGRIDGLQALAMAVGAATEGEVEKALTDPGPLLIC